MKEYFRLNSYAYFVEGKENGCIYNLQNGNMIILNKKNSDMLRMCEKNTALQDILDVDYELLDKLQDMDIGLYYDAPVFVDKLAFGVPQQLEPIVLNNYEINTVFIEIENQCNFNCVFCKKDDNKLFRKTGCKQWKVGEKLVSIEEWKNVIKQVAKLSCQHILFIGGEPFLNEHVLKDLCTYAYESGIKNISIYTNGYILDQNMIQFLKKYNIELRIQILGYYNRTYEEIMGKENVAETVFRNVKKLSEENIKYRLIYLVCHKNEDEIEVAFEKYSRFTQKHQMMTDFIYPIPDNQYYSKKYLDIMYDKKKNLSSASINVYHFCNAKKQHNCYGQQIGITASGDVIPCIMSRNFIMGNVKEKLLGDILSNVDNEYYRKLTKDKIVKCKTCSLRYGCFDCRALEFSATGDIHGMEYCNFVQEVGNGKC